jgi:hypothetical protein
MSALIGGSIAGVAGLYIMKIGLKKGWDYSQYKILKHKIYHKLQTNIDNLNHSGFLENIDKLKAFSAHYNKNKYYSFKKKEKINDAIIQDPILFKMKYDPNYLILFNNKSETDLEDRMKKVEESLMLKESENRLDL